MDFCEGLVAVLYYTCNTFIIKNKLHTALKVRNNKHRRVKQRGGSWGGGGVVTAHTGDNTGLIAKCLVHCEMKHFSLPHGILKIILLLQYHKM